MCSRDKAAFGFDRDQLLGDELLDPFGFNATRQMDIPD